MSRNLLEDTVAMKRERSNMPVGMAASGYCVNDCEGICVVSVFPRGTAVVELHRASKVFNPASPFLFATHRNAVPLNRGWSMFALTMMIFECGSCRTKIQYGSVTVMMTEKVSHFKSTYIVHALLSK